MHTDLDALVIALYVRIDDLLPRWRGRGCPPPHHRRLSSSPWRWPRCSWPCEATAGSWGLPSGALDICFRICPSSPATASASGPWRPRSFMSSAILPHTSRRSSTGCGCWTRPLCPAGSRSETARRSELSGSAAYGWCASHSRHFWGFRLYLLCAPDEMPIAFELAPANAPERVVATQIARAVSSFMATRSWPTRASRVRTFKRPWPPSGHASCAPIAGSVSRRNGSLGPVRQWIESVFWTCKGQLSLERHGGRTLTGVCVRVALRLLALAAGPVHNHQIGNPGRHFAAYGY